MIGTPPAECVARRLRTYTGSPSTGSSILF